ncbi:AcrR family transcriptional regulator [Nocardia transvalensis]|uniref:AcrR family transcriptional regulator n=1 Tax=Nocardia transvalensis TaxID=37333 RepID=A0A7W9ULR2_9NOCA|nr:TetR family transcriptional regulator [Nocardia transvalensis]MBB5917627.1 AcrR family transcriptional regulator [Nocardia transvalensis]
MTDDSRARILKTSLALFAERGFHAVSVREIAEQIGLTKTAVLYHFPSKIDIVVALVEPLLVETEALLESIRPIADPDARRWAVVEGLLDTWLRHTRLLRMHMQDQALSADDATYARLRDIALSAQELIAGPGADLVARVRAAQVYAALSDPVVFFADQPEAEVRTAILAGAQRLLGSPLRRGGIRSEVARETPHRRPSRGRPGAMTSAMVESARRMRGSGNYTVGEIASELGVSRATVYRYLTTAADT